MACDIDQTTGKFFMSMEYYNHKQGKPNGTMLAYTTIKTDPNWWQTGWTMRYFTGLFNPDIVAEKKNVYIVGETPNGTQLDIVCQHSSTSGSSFLKTVVAYNATFPSVSIVKELMGTYTVICSYVRGGNLYASVSADGGATWQERPAINDEAGKVVAQYSCASVNGPYAAWTDNRSTPTSIYFDNVTTPPKPPVLEIKNVKGIIGVSASIANIGQNPAHNVTWEIKVTGGLLSFINKVDSGTIPLIAVGEEKPIKGGIVLGFGVIKTEVNVNCLEGASDSDSKDGTNLIFLTFIKT
jgi:hypothetical protein